MCFMYVNVCECCIYYSAQNENVGHAATSERIVLDLHRPDCRTSMKVLVAKSFMFVETLWASHVQTNMHNLL